MRVPLEAAPAQVQLRLPDLPVVAAHRLGGRDAGAQQDPAVHHLLRARQAQAAQVLVRLLVHHEQASLCLHGFDALHDLQGREISEQKPREPPSWGRSCTRGPPASPLGPPAASALLPPLWMMGRGADLWEGQDGTSAAPGDK